MRIIRPWLSLSVKVAAFAAGVLEVSDLQGMVPMEEDDDHQKGRVDQEDSTEDDENSDDDDESDDEGDDESKADCRGDSSPGVGGPPEVKPDAVLFMEDGSDRNVKDSDGKQETETQGASSNGQALKPSPEKRGLSTEDDDTNDTSSSSDDNEL